MSKRWHKFGMVAFWLGWPLMHLALRHGSRTRVLICVGSEILTVKGIISGGKWSLPGGGVKRGEEPQAGAIREVFEETRIVLKPKQLKFKGTFKGVNSEKHRYTYHVFVVQLKVKPGLQRQQREVSALQWQNAKKAATDPAVSKVAREVIAAWYPW